MKILKNPYIAAKKDRFNSTFIQEIRMLTGKRFTGYSAAAGYAEKNDKQAVLINFILRMYKCGYLNSNRTYRGNPDPIEHIEYFLNLESGKKSILRLYFDYYEAFPGIERFKSVISFLDSFYSDIHKGLNVEQIYNKLYRSDRSPVIDPMDYIPKRFITQKSLQGYLTRSTDNKTMSIEQALYFERKYIEHHNLSQN